MVTQVASLEVSQVASQVGDNHSSHSGNNHSSHSQHQDGLASREEASGARLRHLHLPLHQSSQSNQSNLHRHKYSQLLLRLRDPQ